MGQGTYLNITSRALTRNVAKCLQLGTKTGGLLAWKCLEWPHPKSDHVSTCHDFAIVGIFVTMRYDMQQCAHRHWYTISQNTSQSCHEGGSASSKYSNSTQWLPSQFLVGSIIITFCSWPVAVANLICSHCDALDGRVVASSKSSIVWHPKRVTIDCSPEPTKGNDKQRAFPCMLAGAGSWRYGNHLLCSPKNFEATSDPANAAPAKAPAMMLLGSSVSSRAEQ